jgi:squalene-hopene/tetraprenyl-beta-curcumene cyclase
MPLLVWSHREAKRRGFAIDDRQFAEFVDWSNERAKDVRAGAEVLAFLKLSMPENPAPELTKLIVDRQQADGSWKPAGQFATMQRRDSPEATGNSARLFLLALATQGADQPLTEAAREKAKALLEKNDPPKSVETLVFRMLYARRFGQAQEVGALRMELVKLQHPDGGWGWMMGEKQSDPLATGEALYVLQQAPEASSADAMARARNWLLSQQREDGGWSIDITRISKIDRSAPAKSKSLKDVTGIYTFWGSAWAAMGLLEGLPIVEAQAR